MINLTLLLLRMSLLHEISKAENQLKLLSTPLVLVRMP